MAFCGTCGSKLPVEEAVPEVEEQRAFCGACGAPIAADTVFCTNCGNKVG
jgi:DNA-directed RNA polymerase subunit RPC12/RpoP